VRNLCFFLLVVLAGCSRRRIDGMSAKELFRAAERHRGADRAERAFERYSLLAEKYPDTIYTVRAIGHMIDYHVYRRDYTAAEKLLERVFSEYPDSPYLDIMGMRWVIVAYGMGDLEKVRRKCHEVVSNYPASKHRPKAQKTLELLNARLGPAESVATP